THHFLAPILRNPRSLKGGVEKDSKRVRGKLFDHFPVLNTTEPRISNCAFCSLANRVPGETFPVLVEKYGCASVGCWCNTIDVICRLNRVHSLRSEEGHKLLTRLLPLTGDNPILIIPFLDLTPSDVSELVWTQAAARH